MTPSRWTASKSLPPAQIDSCTSVLGPLAHHDQKTTPPLTHQTFSPQQYWFSPVQKYIPIYSQPEGSLFVVVLFVLSTYSRHHLFLKVLHDHFLAGWETPVFPKDLGYISVTVHSYSGGILSSSRQWIWQRHEFSFSSLETQNLACCWIASGANTCWLSEWICGGLICSHLPLNLCKLWLFIFFAWVATIKYPEQVV